MISLQEAETHPIRNKQTHIKMNSKSNNKLPLFISPILTLALVLTLHLDQFHCYDVRSSRAQNSSCPAYWLNLGSKCYKASTSLRSLETSKTRCGDLGAKLAVLEDDSTKEEESSAWPMTHGSSLISGLLANNKLVQEPVKLYYVNVSQELGKQNELRLQHESISLNGGAYGEHMDLDYTLSDLWLPRDDPSLQQFRFNVTNTTDSNPGFALVYSKHYKKWGIMLVPPTRKAFSICERPANMNQGTDLQAPQSPGFAHPVPDGREHHQRQSIEAKRAKEMLGQESNHATQGALMNRAGSDQSTTAAPPELPSALFRDFPQNQSIILGSTSEMRCSAIDNDSNLMWTFNGRNLTQSNRIKILPNGVLRIEHVRNSDGGNYNCTIHSGGLTESRMARLEIIERPHQPEYITAELLDKLSTSVRIKWTPGFNGNSPITKYLVEMRTVGGEGNSGNSEDIVNSQSSAWEIAKANVSADQTSVIIPDLKPARKYIFRIKATNKVGTGDPSLPTREAIEVPIQPPSMAPVNISGTARLANSVSLQWSPPPADSQNGVIKGYKIRHKLAGYAANTDWYTNDAPEATHLNFLLDDLITWQNYEIQIAAENDKGVGPFSSSIFVRTKEGKPDRGPINVVAEAISPTVIKIQWNPPSPQHINGINQGYKVQAWLDVLQTQLAKEVVVAPNPTTPLQSTSIDGLLPYTEYYISVKCFTSAGDGVSNEDLIRARTNQDLPEIVPILEFSDVLDKSLKVIWKPPKRINGELNHYTLEYSESANTDKKIHKEYPPGTSEARITDLSPQTRYTFKIYAHTIGQGPGQTNNITTSVPPVLPEPPSKLVPTQIESHSVTIQFEPGFDGNANIERWTAEALSPSLGEYQPRWQIIYVSTNHSQGNTVVVRNLRPFTRYKIRLTPGNVVGNSRYASEPTVEFQTSQVEPEQPPRDLAIEDVRSNSAVAHWSPLSNSHWLGLPRGYNLTWAESNNSTVLYHFINDTRADSLFIRDLEEFTEYTFKIYAINDVGMSPPSESIVITTLEDVPSSSPTNVTAHALSSSSVSIDWNNVPKRYRNGIIRGYKVQYQAQRSNAPLQHRTIEDNATKHITLNDLKPYTTYHLALAAYTLAGDGVYSPVISVHTLEDTPGMPQNISSPTVSQTTARILWDPPEDPNGEILGYKVSYHALTEGNKEMTSQELHHNERTFKATNLKSDLHYLFTVAAKTKEGWGQQASMMLYTYDPELRANLPFFKESWFVILCACSSVVITIIITALLFIQTKSYKYKQEAIKSTSQDRLGDAGFSIDDEPGNHYNNGFGLLSNNANHRRSNGALSQSTANFTLPKTPPRPHPGSAVYSDDDDGDDDVFEDVVEKPVRRSIAGTSHYDSSGDSLTEKPSEISSSPAPESESADEEYVNMANKHFVNHYANVNGTLRSQRSWKKNGAGPSRHYTSSSHRTKPKLPQRPAPTVPQVPNDHGQSSSDNATGQPVAGTSGMQIQRGGGSIYGESSGSSKIAPLQHPTQQPQITLRQIPSNQSLQQQPNGINDQAQMNPKMLDHQQQQQSQSTQHADLLNGHIVNLNGGRIIVDNMAGSRAPLPGFTSFV